MSGKSKSKKLVPETKHPKSNSAFANQAAQSEAAASKQGDLWRTLWVPIMLEGAKAFFRLLPSILKLIYQNYKQ